MEFKYGKVSFHLKDKGKVFVTTASLVGNVVMLVIFEFAENQGSIIKMAMSELIAIWIIEFQDDTV
jgi:hypothetical protein